MRNLMSILAVCTMMTFASTKAASAQTIMGVVCEGEVPPPPGVLLPDPGPIDTWTDMTFPELQAYAGDAFDDFGATVSDVCSAYFQAPIDDAQIDTTVQKCVLEQQTGTLAGLFAAAACAQPDNRCLNEYTSYNAANRNFWIASGVGGTIAAGVFVGTFSIGTPASLTILGGVAMAGNTRVAARQNMINCCLGIPAGQRPGRCRGFTPL
jgi:hypothetical protein